MGSEVKITPQQALTLMQHEYEAIGKYMEYTKCSDEDLWDEYRSIKKDLQKLQFTIALLI